MGVALTGWGRFVTISGDKITVPAPTTDPGKPWLWDFLAGEAHSLRQAGFTVIQLPPCGKAQGGAFDGCDGYGLFDPRDIGSKKQQGGMPTRYGSAESLRRLVAVANSNGLDIYLDLVLHQRIGADAGAVSFTVPSNTDSGGHSYLCFSHSGLDSAFVTTRRATTQVFFGADDLDLSAVRDGNLTIGRVYYDSATTLSVSVSIVETGWTANSMLATEIVRPDGVALAWQTHRIGFPAHLREEIPVAGWYGIVLKGANLPSIGSPFQIVVTYTAPQDVRD